MRHRTSVWAWSVPWEMSTTLPVGSWTNLTQNCGPPNMSPCRNDKPSWLKGKPLLAFFWLAGKFFSNFTLHWKWLIYPLPFAAWRCDILLLLLSTTGLIQGLINQFLQHYILSNHWQNKNKAVRKKDHRELCLGCRLSREGQIPWAAMLSLHQRYSHIYSKEIYTDLGIDSSYGNLQKTLHTLLE